ncbi:hypothetical protein MNBD_GAMMA17-1463 [hydrothermal vent metagenome]|uniref:PilZ domain-containing protein n=1 Tax=hydrothermal vent metagenome TaxID=652676 RepID=A0A3B0Z3J2_9ZZZZ
MKKMRQTKRVIPAHQPKGKLVLLVKEQRFDVTSVRDISPFGIGVYIERGVVIDEEVCLSYQTEAEECQVYGVVAWSASVKSDVVTQTTSLFRIGICLNPENVESNLNFYRLMVD